MFRKLLVSLLCLILFGGAALAQDADPVPMDTGGTLFQTLNTGNVYVDPNVQHVDAQTLEQAAMQGQGNPHTQVKIAVLAALPPEYLTALHQAMTQDTSLAARVRGQERSFYTFRLHKALNLDKEPLVLVALSGPDRGVSVWTTALDANARQDLARQYSPAIQTNPTQGTADLAQAVAAAINGKEYRSSAGLWLVFLLVVAVLGGLLVSASRRRKQALAAARGPIQALRENVLSGIEYLDGYLDVLPKNNPDSDQVRLFRQAASAKYDQAVKIMDRATEMTDLQRAQGLLDQAQGDVQQARRYQDKATGGTSNIPGDEAVRPQPLPESQPAVEAIPPRQRGVSFFSGRPAPLSSLVPVTLTVNNQSRQVLVTPDEADELRRGRMPQVLAFQQGGQYTPWYEYNGYDPYRDYWRYENAGWGGYGSGVVAGFVAAEVLDSLLMPPFGMPGYMPYAYATDMPVYQGYADPNYGSGDFGGSFAPSDNNNDFAGTTNTGGDFFNNGSGFDTQGFDTGDQSAGNFYSDSGFDSGGSDFGGGGDFGGGDSGGGGGGDS